uniref:GPN-loop GTPase 3 n=1 Tax=Ganoderma boninense TaxID=34458 RepID=A0A5K1JWX4_9APHY|nr:GPN-loop GTPase 3 [Ganoderma boninense]
MRYAVLVTGPAGAGKSTFCNGIMTHLQTSKRSGHLVNMDPAANSDAFEYEPSIDIRDLITLEDVMEELGYGPNGGLVYCFEYLLENMDWLDEELGGYEDDYLIIDCPGELTAFHAYSGVLSAMSAMVNLEVPWLNIMSKMDLVTANVEDKGSGRNGIRTRKDIARFLEADPMLLVSAPGSREELTERNSKFHALNQAIVQLIEDHPLVKFLALDLTNPDSIETVLSHIDYVMQYGEDEEPKEPGDLDEGDFADME